MKRSEASNCPARVSSATEIKRQQGGILDQHDRLPEQRRDRHLEGLRQDDKAHALDIGHARGDTGLDLSARDRQDAGADDLGDVGAAVQRRARGCRRRVRAGRSRAGAGRNRGNRAAPAKAWRAPRRYRPWPAARNSQPRCRFMAASTMPTASAPAKESSGQPHRRDEALPEQAADIRRWCGS